ncbi:MAG: pyruvate oxidase [Myxococcota bacterium]|jgi:pyruvate oxidase
MTDELNWHRAADLDQLPDGRVMTVTCDQQSVCLTHFEGKYAALDNRCPHQGGPLGEGSIENGWLRCPWHGWDFHPCTGKSPGGYGDGIETFPVDVRDDGIYIGLAPNPPRERTVTDVMAETMVAWGVTSVFGMVGHSNLGLADAVRLQAEAGNLRYIGIRHEGAASFACSAYGKLTGRPAACLAIAGPGATNLLTGLWDAHVDRAPVLALTGQVPTKLIGRGAFQEVDLAAAFGGVAVYTGTLMSNSEPAELMTLACKNALIGRGVSHLVFPDEIQTKLADGTKASGPVGRIGSMEVSPPTESFNEAFDALAAAEKPVIIVGHGARFSMDKVTALAEKLGAPVLTTFKAKGQISDNHPLGCGVLGRSGTPVASWFMNESDLLLVFGASFSNHTGITDHKPTIQVDLDPMALGRFHAVDFPVLGEIGVTATQLIDRLSDGKSGSTDRSSQVAQRWSIWREEKARRATENRGNGLDSASIFQALTATVPKDAIIAVDVGNNAYSFGRYFEATGQAVLMSGYLGSIGFALPASMGAWAATQEDDPRFAGRKVVSISGDGGLGQYLAELTTLAKYDMNITHVVLNNGQLGKISKEQRAGEWPVWETELTNPDFAAVAAQCGLHAFRIERPEELIPVLRAALTCPGPSLVEIIADASLI